jgi:hypothetical protein
MGYQKYECPTCNGKFYVQQDHPRSILDGSHTLPKCPNRTCRKKKLSPLRFVKLKPDHTFSPLTALVYQREPRRRNIVDYDERDDSNEELPDDEDDEDFLPTPRGYNLAMRYHGGSHAVRHVFPTITNIANTTWTRIAMSTGRSNTNTCMGTAINGRGSLPAQKHSGRGVPYKRDKFNSDEWCHLIADSLGGPTSAANLVAASFGANTFMAVIESKIQNNTKIEVKVKAYCSAPYVAEHIVYKLRATGNSNKQIEFSIDGCCQDFDQNDAFVYGKQVTDFLKLHGLTKK